MEELHKFMGPSLVDDHFRLFAAMIAGAPASEYEVGGSPERGRQIFPAQCWKDFVCATRVMKSLEKYHTMVVSGCGHTDYGLGIPSRVQALVKRQQRDWRPAQLILTARASEETTTSFRGHILADTVIRYNA